MAPKSAASIRVQSLKDSGMTRTQACTAMLSEFPDLTKGRRSQLLTAVYGKVVVEGEESNKDENVPMATPVKSQKAFILDLKSRGIGLIEARTMIQTEFPNMSPSQRSNLFSAHWNTSTSSNTPCDEPHKRRRLHVKQKDPTIDRQDNRENEAQYLEEAMHMRSLLREVDVPRDGHCFYH